MKVSLREVGISDIKRCFEIQADTLTREMAGYPERTWEEYQTHWNTKLSEPGVVKRAVVVEEKIVGLFLLFTRNEVREIGYVLDRSTWGKGVGSEALSLFLKEIQESPVYAIVQSANSGSIRVLQKNDFRFVEKKPGTAELLVFVR